MKTRTVLIGCVLLLACAHAAWSQPVVNPRTVTVSPDGTGASFSNLAAALNSITTASAANPYVILVYPGTYTGSNNGGNLTWKSWVSLRGVDRKSTIIRGSIPNPGSIPSLIDMNGLEGVEISNITLDGSAQMAVVQSYESGALSVCGARVMLDRVTYLNASAGFASGASLSSLTSGGSLPCTGPGEITIRNSDLAPIYDFGNSWNISGTRISVLSALQTLDSELVYAYIHAPSPGFAGKVSITGSVLESVARIGSSVADNYPLYVYGRGAGMHIVGSSIIGRTEIANPSFDTAAVFLDNAEDAGTGEVVIEGSLIQYESINGATGGEFFGIFSEALTGGPAFSTLHVRGSTIRSIGSGGTRSDVRNDGNTDITLAATQFATPDGLVLERIKTADLRLGQFSGELTVPLAAPPATIFLTDGRVWVDPSTNKFCYRSGGQALCVAGSPPVAQVFMRVEQIGTAPTSGNVVCKKVGGQRRGEALVIIRNRDTGVPIGAATITGNWSGAVTQNGVTGQTATDGSFTFQSNTAPPGGSFTFTVTNVQRGLDTYDPASNIETSDSSPICN
jgi:hypothetical protein